MLQRLTIPACLAAMLLSALPAPAGQLATDDPDRAVNVLFWPQLYRNGGVTLYCRQPFRHKLGLTAEHVYSLRWMAKALDCADAESCRASEPAFGYMESDLHNLFPARLGTAAARDGMPFGFVPGDQRDFGADCLFKVSPAWALAQPPPEARGEIARAILYMMYEYGLPLPHLMARHMILSWHEQDPPDDEERRRNDTIGGLQGTRNPFVDDPAAAGRLIP